MTREQTGYLLGGLGMFLFGTFIFEEAINALMTSSLRSFFRTATNTLLKSIGVGIGVTALLQSSGVVSLIVMSFVGAGIFGLSHGVGVILGMNIGAPLFDIVLGTLGLKLSLVNISFFLIGISGIVVLIFSPYRKIKFICKMVFGLGLLFLGLGYMKDAMGLVSTTFDVSQYMHLSVFLYFFLGVAGAVIMQSSTATIVLVLTAASTGIIDYRMGMPIIMGAFLGTTSIAILGSMGPFPLKKQVAFAHVLFNVFSAVLGMIFLSLIVSLFRIFSWDTVTGLSVFAIGYKIVGALLMIPCISPFVRLLKWLFPERQDHLHLAIDHVSPHVPDAAKLALHHDVLKLLKKTFDYVMHIWEVDQQALLLGKDAFHKRVSFDSDRSEKEYHELKILEERIVSFVVQTPYQEYLQSTRSVMTVAKYMKDIAHNLSFFQQMKEGWFIDEYLLFRQKIISLYLQVSRIIDGKYSQEVLMNMIQLIKDIQQTDDAFLSSLGKELQHETLDPGELSSMLHVHRYVYLSSLSLVEVVKILLLTSDEKKLFDQVIVD